MRSTETQVSEAVVQVLSTVAGGEATIKTLKQQLPNVLQLSDADLTPSVTRPGEALWEQQVRNIVSHRGTPGNFVHEGLLEYRPRRLALTAAGRARLR
jgi:hypothetical protein